MTEQAPPPQQPPPRNELDSELTPRVTLEAYLESDPGAVKMSALADRAALTLVQAETAKIETLDAPAMLTVARQAQVEETIRQRSTGPDATVYGEAYHGGGGVFDRYYAREKKYAGDESGAYDVDGEADQKYTLEASRQILQDIKTTIDLKNINRESPEADTLS